MYEWMYLDPNKKNSKMFHFISFSGKIFFNQKLQKGKIENCHKYLNPLPNQIFRRNSVGVKHAWPKCCIRYGAIEVGDFLKVHYTTLCTWCSFFQLLNNLWPEYWRWQRPDETNLLFNSTWIEFIEYIPRSLKNCFYFAANASHSISIGKL